MIILSILTCLYAIVASIITKDTTALCISVIGTIGVLGIIIKK
jgi:hypothetical protein